MNLERLTCNSCGAPLEVPETTNFVKCNHCSASLAVRRTAGATFTEQLEELAERTEELSEKIDNLSTQNEIAGLDREWDFEREKYMIKTKHGNRHVPTEGGAVVGGILVTAFGIFWTFMATGSGAGAFAMFGILFIGAGIASSISGFNKAGHYKKAERRYRQRRSDLINESE